MKIAHPLYHSVLPSKHSRNNSPSLAVGNVIAIFFSYLELVLCRISYYSTTPVREIINPLSFS